tara:strand:+ start:531 stop:2006 length:1476 start_codon:yes stop_codon:yes gene_type:complete
MAVVYRKSELGTFLEQLPGLILQYQKQQADRAYDTNMFLLRNEIDKQRELEQQENELALGISSLGITTDALTKVSDEDYTFNADDIINASGAGLSSILNNTIEANKNTQENINNLSNDLALINFTRNTLANIQDDDPTVSEQEADRILDVFSKSPIQKSFPDNDRAIDIIQQASGIPDPEFYRRVQAKKEARSLEEKVDETIQTEEATFVKRAENYPTIRSKNNLNDSELKNAILERDSIVRLYNNMDTFKLDQIAELGGTQGGAGYIDQVPGEYDYSDRLALEAGLIIEAKKDLEEKLGNKGYDDDSIDAWVQAALEGIDGGQVVDIKTGNPTPISANPASTALGSPLYVDQYKATVGASIVTKDPSIIETMQQRSDFVEKVKSLVFNAEGKEIRRWGDIKKEAKSVGFKSKKEYEQSIATLQGIQDIDILGLQYTKDPNLRNLLKLLGVDASFIQLTREQQAIQEKLKMEEEVMPENDKDDFLDSLLGK